MDHKLYHPLAHAQSSPASTSLPTRPISTGSVLPRGKSKPSHQPDRGISCERPHNSFPDNAISSLATTQAAQPSTPIGPMLSKATASGYSSTTNFSASSKLKAAGGKLYSSSSPSRVVQSQSFHFSSGTVFTAPTTSPSLPVHRPNNRIYELSRNTGSSPIVSNDAFTSTTDFSNGGDSSPSSNGSSIHVDSHPLASARHMPDSSIDLSVTSPESVSERPLSSFSSSSRAYNSSTQPSTNESGKTVPTSPGSGGSTIGSNNFSFASPSTTILHKRKLKSPRPRIVPDDSPQQLLRSQYSQGSNSSSSYYSSLPTQPLNATLQSLDLSHPSLSGINNNSNNFRTLNKSPLAKGIGITANGNSRFSHSSSLDKAPKVRSSQSPITEKLIQEIFLPREPLPVDWRDKLPSLCSSDEVNVELYALVGLVCRQFVLSWYYGIVDDPSFLSEIATLLAKSLRLLEERLVELDVYSMLLDEIPMILEMHVNDYRTVKQRYRSSILPKNTLETAFHSLRPHPALDSPEDEKLFLKILAKGLVAFLLDEKDLNSPLAQTFMRAAVENLGLSAAIDKLSEPWMLHEIITKVFEIYCPETFAQIPTRDGTNDNEKESKGGLSEKTDSKISSKENTTSKLNDTQKTNKSESQSQSQIQISKNSSMSILINSQAGNVYQKVAKQCASLVAQCGKLAAFILSFSGKEENASEHSQVPFVATSLFSCIKSIFLADERRPLIIAALRVLSSPLAFGRLRKVCNRIVCHFIDTSIRSEHTIAAAIRATRQTLFGMDNGMLGPPRVYPTDQEQKEAREKAMLTILTCTPNNICSLLFGDSPKEGIYEVLDLLDNKVVNKHLIYNILDHLITALVPELADMTPQELMNLKLGRMRQMI